MSFLLRPSLCFLAGVGSAIGVSKFSTLANADSTAAPSPPLPPSSSNSSQSKNSSPAAPFPFMAKKSDDDCEVCSDRADDFFKQISTIGKPAASGPGWQGEGLKCPLDRREVGRSTWDFLHTMAANYPELPTPKQQSDMNTFMYLVSEFYPCGYCADRMKDELIIHPPVTHSRRALMQWMCGLHNEVNDRMGKQMFDCSKYEERWRTGPADGSCGTRRKQGAASGH